MLLKKTFNGAKNVIIVILYHIICNFPKINKTLKLIFFKINTYILKKEKKVNNNTYIYSIKPFRAHTLSNTKHLKVYQVDFILQYILDVDKIKVKITKTHFFKEIN